MGQTSDAHCFACGYDIELTISGARSSSNEYSNWPVSCADCHTISSANIRALPLRCANCNSQKVTELQDPSVYAGDGTRDKLRNLDRVLTDGHYLCPVCHKFELRIGTDVGGRGRILFD
jgi:hypothetical protein